MTGLSVLLVDFMVLSLASSGLKVRSLVTEVLQSMRSLQVESLPKIGYLFSKLKSKVSLSLSLALSLALVML